jgi:hypothetical protein
VLSQALQAAQAIGDDGARAVALRELLPQVPEGERAAVLSQALQAAQAIGDDGARAAALRELLPQVPEGERAAVLSQALQAAQAIGDDGARSTALWVLAPHLPARFAPDLLKAFLQSVPQTTRPRVLERLIAYLPLHMQLEGRASLHEIHQAIYDTAKWFR